MPDNHFVVQANVITEEIGVLREGLRELTVLLLSFTSGTLSGRRHSTYSADDYRGWSEAALVGFGPSFFIDRATGTDRFRLLARPRHLDYLRLRGDEAGGIDPLRSQTDLVICIESESLANVIDAYSALRTYLDGCRWAEFVRLQQGSTRGDGKNYLGQYDGIHNPSLKSVPGVADVAFATRNDEPPGLESGSYMVVRRYNFDMGQWRKMATPEQESVAGTRQAAGEDLRPFPPGCHVGNALAAGAPKILRRGVSFLDAEKGQPGLIFISFQKDPDFFVRLHNDFLVGPSGSRVDRMLTNGAIRPVSADVYFVPDFLESGFVGEVFFQPDLFYHLFRGAELSDAAQYSEALLIYRDLHDRAPGFLPALTNQADLLPDVDDFEGAASASETSLKLAPNDFLSLGVQAWSLYLVGSYEEGARMARRAVDVSANDAMRAYPYHSLGACLLELRRPQEAEQTLRRSLARVYSEPLVFFSLGNALDAQDRGDEADAAYNAMLEVVRARMESGAVSARDARGVFNMRFIRYTSPRNQLALARVRAYIATAPTTGLAADANGET